MNTLLLRARRVRLLLSTQAGRLFFRDKRTPACYGGNLPIGPLFFRAQGKRSSGCPRRRATAFEAAFAGRNAPHSRCDGFSLLELIIVLTLCGLLAMTFSTRVFSLDSSVAQRECELMASRLAHARAQGILRGWSCLTLSSSGVAYSRDTDSAMSPMPGEAAEAALESVLTLSPSAPRLCFDSLGRVCSSADSLADGTRRSCQGGLGDVTMTFTLGEDSAALLVRNLTGFVEKKSGEE